MAKEMQGLVAYAWRTTLIILLCVMIFPSPSAAQPGEEEEYENLQVLPEDISEDELRAIMSSFTEALGVNCTHCHVREQGQPPNFAADDKPTKQTARLMLRMVQAINGEHLTDLPTVEGAALRVSCITCHHGVTQPRLLEEILADFLPVHGLDSTFAEYDRLREEYYGSFSYDFTDGALIRLAERLLEDENASDALAFLERNLEMYPSSTGTLTTMADAYLQMGNREEAIAQLERALELEPQNNRLRRQIEQLQEEQ